MTDRTAHETAAQRHADAIAIERHAGNGDAAAAHQQASEAHTSAAGAPDQSESDRAWAATAAAQRLSSTPTGAAAGAI